MAERKLATRQSWRNLHPLPASKSLLPFNRSFTQEEFGRIALGLIPLAMEDKWFIFCENNWLSFHRSWTGNCIYQLRLEKEGDSYSVFEAWVNRDPNQYKETDNAYDASLLSFLIDNFLLGKETAFPLPGDLPKDVPQGISQHNFSGSGYHEVSLQKKDEDS